jgi:hypothetical protein
VGLRPSTPLKPTCFRCPLGLTFRSHHAKGTPATDTCDALIDSDHHLISRSFCSSVLAPGHAPMSLRHQHTSGATVITGKIPKQLKLNLRSRDDPGPLLPSQYVSSSSPFTFTFPILAHHHFALSLASFVNTVLLPARPFDHV